jgi:osmotically-inducible protein OsmY
MSEHRWYDDDYRRDERRSWTERAGDEVRSWLGDDEARMRRGNDERHDHYPYGGERYPYNQRSAYGSERSWRDQGDGSYDRGGSGWRGREYGTGEGSRFSGSRYGGYGSSPSDDESRDYYGRSSSDRWRDGRQDYGRGGQYGSTTYDRGQLRRSYSDWTPGAAAGARDWERRDTEDRGRFGSSWNEPGYGQAGSWSGSERYGTWGRGGDSYAGRGPKGYRRSDERIREEVSDTLTADPRVDASEITVNVEGGVVTLTGTVSSRDQKRRAEDCAEGVSGVSDVTNNLRVNREDSRPEQQDVSRNVTPSLADQGRSR